MGFVDHQIKGNVLPYKEYKKLLKNIGYYWIFLDIVVSIDDGRETAELEKDFGHQSGIKKPGQNVGHHGTLASPTRRR